jgi:hypothetical protein
MCYLAEIGLDTEPHLHEKRLFQTGKSHTPKTRGFHWLSGCQTPSVYFCSIRSCTLSFLMKCFHGRIKTPPPSLPVGHSSLLPLESALLRDDGNQWPVSLPRNLHLTSTHRRSSRRPCRQGQDFVKPELVGTVICSFRYTFSFFNNS